ncbi:MAG: helix-turn-helix domain-containing protein [Clostridia bacterium]|nr:helix-turn-helix domain-containing protein [Clostridia bacterium]
MNKQNKPAYYAIIPSNVRYCEELKFAERLLYGEITALCGKEGYCFATNKYFADLYNVIPGTISRWISHLEKLGFIKVIIIKDEKNQIIERRIYINDIYKDILPNTYKQNKQYPYKQNCLYPMSKKTQYNNINIRIDRFFNYIIKEKKQNPEKFSKEEDKEFKDIITELEFNYNEDSIKIIKDDNIDKLKIIIYALKELFKSNKKYLIYKARRNNLISVYDNCRVIELEYKETENEINNFFEYYYKSIIKELEKG